MLNIPSFYKSIIQSLNIRTVPKLIMTTTLTAAPCMALDYEHEHILTTLRNGGSILYPTDTIWGIGCDATNAEAVERVFEIKNRPGHKALVLLVADTEMLRQYIEVLHPRLETLMLFNKRPLTIIYDGARNLPENVLGGGTTVAIRIPNDDFCKELIAALGRPIVSTSANISGEPFPSFFGEISSEIIENVDAIAQHRRWDKTPSQPSVIARMDDRDELEFLRT